MHLGGCGGTATLTNEPKPQLQEGPWAVMISALGSA